MSTKKYLIGVLAAAVVLSSCTSKNNGSQPTAGKIVVDSTGIMNDPSLSSNDKAEKLALAAEQLMTAESFMYASAVADSALTIDANNKRAQLIKGLTAPAMVNKGILERIKPIAYRNADSRKQYDASLAGLLKAPNSALKTFLFEGSQDIKTEKDAQKFISEVHSAYDRLRIWFRDNKNIDMTLHIPAQYANQTLKNQIDNCMANQPSPGVYTVECDFTQVLEVNINQADIEVAQHIVAGYEIFSALSNSYDLSGAIANIDKYANVSNPSTKVVIADLLKDKDFGVLRDSTSLKNILSMGLDGLAGLRWAQKIQNQLCPNRSLDKPNRPGYLVSIGICVDQDNKPTGADDPRYRTLGDVLRNVEVALRGGVIGAIFNGSLGSIDTDIKPSAILATPIQNVRSLTPLRYDKCENIVGIADNTFGGIFVHGDVNAVLLLNNNNCAQPTPTPMAAQTDSSH